jgi:hypothetical protein
MEDPRFFHLLSEDSVLTVCKSEVINLSAGTFGPDHLKRDTELCKQATGHGVLLYLPSAGIMHVIDSEKM